jgi:hypothetical protein
MARGAGAGGQAEELEPETALGHAPALENMHVDAQWALCIIHYCALRLRLSEWLSALLSANLPLIPWPVAFLALCMCQGRRAAPLLFAQNSALGAAQHTAPIPAPRQQLPLRLLPRSTSTSSWNELPSVSPLPLSLSLSRSLPLACSLSRSPNPPYTYINPLYNPPPISLSLPSPTLHTQSYTQSYINALSKPPLLSISLSLSLPNPHPTSPITHTHTHIYFTIHATCHATGLPREFHEGSKR